ncbi:MAG: DinB family protein [Frankiales bacterium]|nr:DinB family protein [Frankiales bacterium]
MTAISPDTKDWTWVLRRPCPECGFDAAAVQPSDVGPHLRQAALDLCDALRRPDAAVRPDPARWSPLEYACHVRDVYRLYLTRLDLMLGQDDPLFANWDQDQTAVTERYDLQDAALVARELAEATDALTSRYAGLAGDAWDRTGRRSDGATFTVRTFSQYLVHDPVHHVWDVSHA